MNTQFSKAYLVTSTLVLSTLMTGVMPATTIYAASQGAQHRSAVAAERSRSSVQSPAQVSSIQGPTEMPTQAEAVAQTEKQTAKSPTVQQNVTNAATHSPAGNNGFIKVNEEELSDSIPNNDPHVSCQFKVEFYNYDQNPANRARVSFALHNPTAGNGYSLTTAGDLNPVIGGDAAGGGNDIDAVVPYKLTFTGQPHEKQGYHVKLTIHADGSRGADVKHKVFWVKPCQGQVLGSTTEGKVLSTSTTRETSAVLPVILPSTGTNPYGFAITLVAAALTYVLTFGAQKLRAFRA